jgi:uroporphyrinogen decarboxylase
MVNNLMDKAQRVRHALAGEPVDRPPISFWKHNFARENSAEELANETVEQFLRYDWDFIKIQSRASSFSEDWGNRYRRSSEPAVAPTLLAWPVHTVDDLAELRPLDPLTGVLGEQIEALQAIRCAVGPSIPVISTIFAPAMVLGYLVGESVHTMLKLVREYPDQTKGALKVISDSYAHYAQACLENGADGIFFAIKAASQEQMTRDEYQEFGLPFDRPVLAAAGEGWLNMLHLCGAGLYFDVVADLPSPLLNWDIELRNPGLAEGCLIAKRCVIGGVSAKPRLGSLKPEEVAAQVDSALAQTAGLHMMVGPGCSISFDTSDANLMAARRAVQNWRSPTG